MNNQTALVLRANSYVTNGLELLLGNVPSFYMPVGGKELFRYYAKLDFHRIFIVFPKGWQLNDFDIDFFKCCDISVRYSDNFFSEVAVVSKDFQYLGIVLHPVMISPQLMSKPNAIFCGSSSPTDIMEFQRGNKHFSLAYILVESSCSDGDILHCIKKTAVRNLLDNSHDTLFISEVVMNNLSSYLRGRVQHLAARTFNNLHFSNGFLRKTSTNNKLVHEANWFRCLPTKLKEFIPSVIDGNDGGYRIQYIPALSLSEIVMLPDFSHFDFDLIMENVVDYLSFEQAYASDSTLSGEIARHLFYQKMMLRREGTLSTLGIQGSTRIKLNGFEVSAFDEIANDINELVEKTTFTPSLMHGDLCFSNIIFDHLLEKIYVIDPRGTVNDTESSIYGVLEYDITKLLHSVFGLYDYIVFEKFHIEQVSNHEYKFELLSNVDFSTLEQICRNLFSERGYSQQFDIALKLLPSLFLSMIPLHSDDPKRQLALYLRGLQLHHKYWRNSGVHNSDVGQIKSLF